MHALHARAPFRRLIIAFAAAVSVGGASLPTHAADARTDAGDKVRAMADSVMAVLREGARKAEREAVFARMYRANFDNTGIAIWAAGRAWRGAPPAVQQRYLDLFETYVVKAYAYQLSRYTGERLRVDKTETDGNDVVVISRLVHPDPREAREIEMRWRFHRVGSRLLVSDVVIDKISMALTERRAFTDWIRDGGGQLAALVAKLQQKIAEIDGK